MTTRRTFLLSASAVLAAPHVARAQAGRRTVTDALGRRVSIPAIVERVIPTFNYEEFTAIAGVEGWRRVVGMTRAVWEGWRPAIFSKYRDVIPNLAAMPDVGHAEDNSFAAERIIALRPDVVIMAEYAFNTLTSARAQMEAAGIPVVVADYNAQLLERHLASTRLIGEVMGTQERAEALARLYEARFRELVAPIAANPPAQRPRVYFELGQAGAATIGNSYQGTMWGRIATTLGAINIADGRLPGPWGPLAMEAIVAADPQFVFIAGSSWVNRPNAVRTGYDTAPETTRASLRPYAERPAFATLAAVRAGEVHAVEHGLCRTLFDFVAMQYIAKRLYPQRFEALDPVAAFADYHARFLPVPFSGTWMLPLNG
jgi:iron complex transport system substrate-binding protein